CTARTNNALQHFCSVERISNFGITETCHRSMRDITGNALPDQVSCDSSYRYTTDTQGMIQACIFRFVNKQITLGIVSEEVAYRIATRQVNQYIAHQKMSISTLQQR